MAETNPSQCRLQILLAPEARTAEGKRDLRRELERLGLDVSGEGAATLSARITTSRFEQLFGCEPSASEADGNALLLPDRLRDRVISITLAPPHLHLG